MKSARGYIRPRGGKLEAVIIRAEGEKVRKATGYDVGQEDEAEALLEEALRQIQANALPSSGELTVKAWGARWIEDRKARGKLEWPHEKSHLEHFVYGPLGGLALADVTDVAMLDWARGLAKARGPSGKTPSPTYIRKITATARALFKEAVRRHLIERTPCVWEDTDLPDLEANARVTEGGYEAADVGKLVYDVRIPEDRRVLYALEFLTGLRSGEAAARRWGDWEPAYLGRLGRLTAATAYNTRHRVVKTTKTRVEKWIPVHPALSELLEAWKAGGWERFYGRPPTPEDLIVPATKGGHRNNSHSWRCFQLDLAAVGLAHQRHYETRATFISLAEGAGADPEMIARITHASLHGAKDLYRRVRLYWPRMCDAVACIQIPRPREVTTGGGDPGASRDAGEREPAETGSSPPEPGENQARQLAFDSPALPLIIDHISPRAIHPSCTSKSDS
jgi:integrase